MVFFFSNRLRISTKATEIMQKLCLIYQKQAENDFTVYFYKYSTQRFELNDNAGVHLFNIFVKHLAKCVVFHSRREPEGNWNIPPSYTGWPLQAQLIPLHDKQLDHLLDVCVLMSGMRWKTGLTCRRRIGFLSWLNIFRWMKTNACQCVKPGDLCRAWAMTGCRCAPVKAHGGSFRLSPIN